MILYTISMSQWRKAKAQGIEFKDVTVKSGDKLFAPDWDTLMEYKRTLDEEQYRIKFRKLMIKSYNEHRAQWLSLLHSNEPIAIACYCKADKFCHRLILVEYFKAACERLGIPFEYKGEIK